MDEASSKFVDQLALEKLIEEKLARVHHRPPQVDRTLFEPAFHEMGAPLLPIELIREGGDDDRFCLTSPLDSAYPENRVVPLVRHRTTLPERGTVLLVHGLFEDNRAMYGFFVRELNRLGLTVYMTTLPYHHERTPASVRFSGELFLSANLSRTKQAFVQAVLEVRAAYAAIRRVTDTPLCSVGFSMGGTVLLAAVAADDTISAAAVVNPASVLSEVIWTSPICATIKADLENEGWNRATIDRVLATFDPLYMTEADHTRDRTLVIYGEYDQITLKRQYETLLEKWCFANVLKYRAGHLNTLRVPRFAADIAHFFDRISTASPEPRKES